MNNYNSKYCKNCGAFIKPGDNFCTRCGTRAMEVDAHFATQNTLQTDVEKQLNNDVYDEYINYDEVTEQTNGNLNDGNYKSKIFERYEKQFIEDENRQYNNRGKVCILIISAILLSLAIAVLIIGVDNLSFLNSAQSAELEEFFNEYSNYQ